MNVIVLLHVVGFYAVLGSLEGNSKLPLRFLHEPRSAVALKNRKVILNCSAEGLSKTTVYWQKDDVRLQNTSERILLPSGSLVIRRFRSNKKKKRVESDVGVYQCFASNNEGTIASRKAKIEVAVLSRKFKESPNNVTIWEGSTARFACKTRRALPEPTITWERNGQPLTPGGRYVVLPNGALQILSVRNSDQGSYRCIAQNVAKKRKSSMGWLTVKSVIPPVKDTPHFAILPRNTSVVSGHQVIMECIATGVPVPSVQWKKVVDSRQSFDATSANKGSSNLEIPSVRAQDGGEYLCIVSGGGKTIEQSVFLFVREPPHFIIKPQAQGIAEAGNTIRLRCSAKGSPPPRITWLKDGKVLSRNSRIMLIHRGEYRDLTISSLSEQDAGVYQCFAENDLGSTQSSTRVIVRRAVTNPWPPRNVTAVTRSDSEILVQWLPPLGDTRVLAYSINYQPVDKSVIEFQVVRQGTSCSLKDLLGYTDYMVYVKPFFPNGSGVRSTTVTVRTLEGKPRSPPINVVLSSNTPDSISVKWNEPPRKYQNGKITSYIIQYSLNSGQGIPQSIQVPGSILQKTIMGLKSGHVYKVQVAATTVKGVGPFSRALVVAVATQPKNVLSSPMMRISSVNSSTLEVTWQPPAFGAKRVKEYRLLYRRADWSGSFTGPVIIAKSINRYLITQLRSNTQYVIRMMAHDGHKAGQQAEEVGHTMPDPAKGPSLDGRCVPESPTSLRVSWIFPSKKVAFYRVSYEIKGNINHQTRSNVDVDSKSTRVSGLRPGRTYLILITPYNAKSKIISGFTGKSMECETPEAKPGSPPKIRRFDVKSSTELKLSWEPPSIPNGKITNYVILYTKDKDLPEKDWTMKTERLSKFFSRFEKYVTTQIKDLTANATYYLKIKAGNNEGYGPFTEVITVSMVKPPKAALADEAPDVSYRLVSGTAVEVSWPHKATSFGKPKDYKLMYTKDITADASMWNELVVPVTWVLRSKGRVVVQLPSLAVNQTYYVKVQARYPINRAGAWSKLLEIQIKDGGIDGGIGPAGVNASIITNPGATSSDARTSQEKEEFQIKLGIIIGCVISAFFIVLLILFVIWRCPCRLNQAKSKTPIDLMNDKAQNGMPNGLPNGYMPPILLSHQSLASNRTAQGMGYEESSGGSSITSSVCQCRCTCNASRFLPPISSMQPKTSQNQLAGNGHIITSNGHLVTAGQVIPPSKLYAETLNNQKAPNDTAPSDTPVPLQVLAEQQNGGVVVGKRDPTSHSVSVDV